MTTTRRRIPLRRGGDRHTTPSRMLRTVTSAESAPTEQHEFWLDGLGTMGEAEWNIVVLDAAITGFTAKFYRFLQDVRNGHVAHERLMEEDVFSVSGENLTHFQALAGQAVACKITSITGTVTNGIEVWVTGVDKGA